MPGLERWRQRAGVLTREVHALALALRDPRVPWYAKALAAVVVAYAVSPIDLIPDVIPVLGQLDDLVLVPLGVLAVRALVPAEVWAECRARTTAREAEPRRWSGLVVVGLWLVIATLGGWALLRWVAS